MTTPNQLGHDTDPTQPPIEEQVRAFFEQKVWDPSMKIDRLSENETTEISGLDASHIPGINDLLPEMSGVDVKAIVEIPVTIDEFTDGHKSIFSAYFAVGRGVNNGWFFARVGTKRANMDLAKDGVRDYPMSPIELGTDAGTRVEIGRLDSEGNGGFVFSGVPGSPEPTRPQPNWSSKILDEFGPSTSRRQLALEVKDSGLEITGLGRFGTRVLKMPDLQLPV